VSDAWLWEPGWTRKSSLALPCYWAAYEATWETVPSYRRLASPRSPMPNHQEVFWVQFPAMQRTPRLSCRVESVTHQCHSSHIQLVPTSDVRYIPTPRCVSKNDTPLACYNFDKHQPILIISGKNVTEKVRNQMMIYFPPHLTNVSALPGKTRKVQERYTILILQTIILILYQKSYYSEHALQLLLRSIRLLQAF